MVGLWLALVLSFSLLVTVKGDSNNAHTRTIRNATFDTGDRYEGEIENNQMHGTGKSFPYRLGTYYFASGERYVGEFANGSMTGRGINE